MSKKKSGPFTVAHVDTARQEAGKPWVPTLSEWAYLSNAIDFANRVSGVILDHGTGLVHVPSGASILTPREACCIGRLYALYEVEGK